MSDGSDVIAILARPTCSLTEAAAVLGIGRGQAYAAAKRGEIPTLRFGRRCVVPTAALKRTLGGDLVDARAIEAGGK
jgi:excisionase family DNA binding protein